MLWIVLSVALRKESVDRNHLDDVDGGDLVQSLSARRAWIEIGVCAGTVCAAIRSLSARRAWIEIGVRVSTLGGWMSLSARRAWIEMQTYKSA